MKRINVLIFSFLFISISFSAFADECGTDLKHQHLMENDPEYRLKHELMEEEILDNYYNNNYSKFENTPVLEIPVVFHIIHNGGQENIPDQRVYEAVGFMNEALANEGYYEDLDIGGDAEITFCLAQQDPNGNPTNGIVRVQNTLTDMDINNDLAVKDLSRWDPYKYLNIWVVNSIGSTGTDGVILGFAYFASSHGEDWDGIVVIYDQVGISGSYTSVLVHEVGHYLNIYHTFQDGCINNDCNSDGDRICDTPPDDATNESTVCGITNSCDTDADDPSPNNPFDSDVFDQHSNFMDYITSACRKNFTPDQNTRMRNACLNQRQSLFTNNDACINILPPVASVNAEITSGCPGSVFSFNAGDEGTPITYSWSFPGGSPSTSNATNPFVTYNSPGSYDVILTVENDNGTDLITLTDYVNIDAAGDDEIFVEDFESGSFYTNGWTNENIDYSYGWDLRLVGGANGGNVAARMPFYPYNAIGARDALISPAIDLSNRTNTKLSIEYAYFNDDVIEPDSLIISISADGAPYEILFAGAEDGSGSFITTTSGSGEFSPDETLDWCFDNNALNGCFDFDLSPYEGFADVHVKLETVNGSGNNLFIDNFNVSSACVPVEAAAPSAGFSADMDTVCLNGFVQFIDESTENPDGWEWTFEGGEPAVSSDQNPTVQYNTPGLYSVSLTASNPIGSSQDLTITDYIYVPEATTLSINGLPSSTSSATPLALDAQPTGGTFDGPGVIINAFNPAIAGPGFHTITYTYEDEFGCVNTTQQQILVVSLTFDFIDYTLGTLAPAKMNGLSIHPNPVVNTASFWMEKNSDSNEDQATIRIFNPNGSILVQKTVELVDYMTIMNLDLSDLEPGMYLAELKTGDGSTTTKFIKE